MSQTPKQVRILGFLYRLSGVICLAIPAYLIYTLLPFGSRSGYEFRPFVLGSTFFVVILFSFVFWLAFHFFMTARGIMKGQAWTRGLILSIPTTVISLFACTRHVAANLHHGWSSFSVTEYYFLVIGVVLGLINFLCTCCLTRQQVKQCVGSARA